MNNELTNVYAIIKKEFPEEVKHFGLDDNREVRAFLHYNAHNEMFIGTDEIYYHNVNFKNLDTGIESRIFREGSLYFFPKGDDLIMPGKTLNAFRIDRGTKSIKLNEVGLFVENNDLKGNIVTHYYDSAAVEAMLNHGLSAGLIDYVEDGIKNTGIQPDRIITAEKKEDGLVISVNENGEVVQQEQIPVDANRTLYSVYYEYMKVNNYYGLGVLTPSESGMNR